jgi:peptide-methionine (S)-S-oxide reductase
LWLERKVSRATIFSRFVQAKRSASLVVVSILASIFKGPQLVDAAAALPGREQPMEVPARHEVLGTPLSGPQLKENPAFELGTFAMGCFWGAERVFWQAPGVYTTAVGYTGGFTPNPTYEEVCSGRTGHAEAVLVVFDNTQTSFLEMLKLFWESHTPTQGMRQGNDLGTQYRSAIFWHGETQQRAAEESLGLYQQMLSTAGHGKITTEVVQAGPFYYAEPYHQQYLAKNPGGYCGLGGTGVSCPVGLSAGNAATPL